MGQKQTAGRTAALTQLERTIRQNMVPPRQDLQLPQFPERSDRLLGVLEAMRAFVIEIDARGTINYVSPQVEEILCLAASEEAGLRLPEKLKTADLTPMPVTSLDEIVAAFKQAEKSGPAQARLPISVVAVN